MTGKIANILMRKTEIKEDGKKPAEKEGKKIETRGRKKGSRTTLKKAIAVKISAEAKEYFDTLENKSRYLDMLLLREKRAFEENTM